LAADLFEALEILSAGSPDLEPFGLRML
jgi:hypothetical protein